MAMVWNVCDVAVGAAKAVMAEVMGRAMTLLVRGCDGRDVGSYGRVQVMVKMEMVMVIETVVVMVMVIEMVVVVEEDVVEETTGAAPFSIN